MSTGRIAAGAVYCTNVQDSWGDPVETFNWKESDQRQTIRFKDPVKARYLKFVATAEVRRNPFAAVAELDVLTDEK